MNEYQKWNAWKPLNGGRDPQQAVARSERPPGRPREAAGMGEGGGVRGAYHMYHPRSPQRAQVFSCNHSLSPPQAPI